jgi:hypothetical protein
LHLMKLNWKSKEETPWQLTNDVQCWLIEHMCILTVSPQEMPDCQRGSMMEGLSTWTRDPEVLVLSCFWSSGSGWP